MSNNNFEVVYNVLKRFAINDNEAVKLALSALYVKKTNDRDEVYSYALKDMDRIDELHKEKIDQILSNDVNVKEYIDDFYNFVNRMSQFSFYIGNEYIDQLAFNLLDIKSNDKIYDLGSGIGHALYDFVKCNNEIKVCGTELSYDQAYISKMIFNLLNINADIIISDGLTSQISDFDKAYVYPPISLRTNASISDLASSNKEFFNSRTSAEWLFVNRTIEKLSGNHKIAALLAPRCLFSVSDLEYRNFLVDNKMIEGIIQLPAGLLSYTSIPTVLVLLSLNNDKTKVLDASQMFTRRGRFVDINVNDILDAYKKTDEISNEELKKSDNLTPSSILAKNKSVVLKYPKAISDVSVIFQGSQYTLKNFESQLSNTETKTKLLTSNDIEDGLIQWDKLKCINDPDSKLLKFKLQKNDIIMTSKSSKVKIAIFDNERDDDVILTGGMLCIRPNTDMISPLFLKMFLDSQIGKEILSSIQKGVIIQTITVSALNSITISCPPIELQNDISKKYKLKLSMYSALKKELEELEYQINNYYEEVEEDL